MKPRVFLAVAAVLVLAACHSQEKGKELEVWADSAYDWTQDINTYLEKRAEQWGELKNVISELCEKAEIAPAECPVIPPDVTDPPLNRPPPYPPN